MIKVILLGLAILLLISLLMLTGCIAHPDMPLARASMAGDVAGVRDLLARGADPNAKDSYDFSPLIWAAREGSAEGIPILLSKGADPNLCGGENGWTPLMHAIHKGQTRTAQALIDAGADVNARNRDGGTAVMMAAGYGYAEIVQMLLNKGADPHAENIHGMDAFLLAVAGVPDIDRFTLGSCQTETVRSLLQKAPDLHLKNDFWGNTALRLAKLRGCSDVLSMVKVEHAGHAPPG